MFSITTSRGNNSTILLAFQLVPLIIKLILVTRLWKGTTWNDNYPKSFSAKFGKSFVQSTSRIRTDYFWIWQVFTIIINMQYYITISLVPFHTIFLIKHQQGTSINCIQKLVTWDNIRPSYFIVCCEVNTFN